MHVREAERTLGSEIPWIADTMTNDLKHAIGDRPNSEYVLDPEGRILSAREWSNPEQLRRDLAEYVGPVEKPTEVADLDLKIKPPPEHAPTGVVPRLEKPGFFRTLVSEPQLGATNEPFCVKLRAEADRALLRDGDGLLYLAFLLDPLYGVHWNNLAPAMEVEIRAPKSVEATPAKLTGPEVEVEADADPREFLVNVSRGESRQPLELQVRYFACTDKFCNPVTQQYRVTWDVDRDAGRVISRRMDFSRPGGGFEGRPGGMIERLMTFDADGDGRLTREELPEPMGNRFARMDADGDGYLEPSEIEAMRERFRRGPGRSGPGGGDRVERMLRFDRNGDGRISREEAPPPLQERFDRLDADDDGELSAEEIRGAR